MLLRSLRLGTCCLTILIYTFKMFKGAMRPRHTYVFGFKGIRLQEKRHTFTGEKAYVYRRKGIRLQEKRHTFTGEKAYVYRKEEVML